MPGKGLARKEGMPGIQLARQARETVRCQSTHHLTGRDQMSRLRSIAEGPARVLRAHGSREPLRVYAPAHRKIHRAEVQHGRARISFAAPQGSGAKASVHAELAVAVVAANSVAVVVARRLAVALAHGV
jgi:hypothetical protein